ncbi:Uncharacterized aminopeptidase ML1167 [Geodia barretti]|uniref:Uncharacterized aminopeptidase ML1167 n=1 Tax=Geodia barretti TaxID=519541 RepID=A0AA35STK2_GEOBA|nr:Uncharacterized aminopeptidase ML1167 [Geodia barretti]
MAGAAAGVDVRGFAPGTRETDAIRPGRRVGQAHGILLTGGSAFGLDAASGVMRFLEEHDAGFGTAHGVVPIVPAAVIYDLGVGDPRVRPDKAMGYRACKAATDAPVPTGRSAPEPALPSARVQACAPQTAASARPAPSCPTAWPWAPSSSSMPSATWSIPPPAKTVADARDGKSGRFVDVTPSLRHGHAPRSPGTNTTIGVIATDAPCPEWKRTW